jgi:hypothetical protein
MMVEARVENDEEESVYLYNTLLATEGQAAGGDTLDDSEGIDAIMTEAQNDVFDRDYKHQLVMKRWASLYDRDGAHRLKQAMMRHLYREKHGDEALETAYQFCDEYNPVNV